MVRSWIWTRRPIANPQSIVLVATSEDIFTTVEGRTNTHGNHIFPGDFWCLGRDLYSVRWRSTVPYWVDDLVCPGPIVSLDGLFRLARVWRSTGRLAGPYRNVRVLSCSRRVGFAAIRSNSEKVKPSRRWYSAFSTSVLGHILNR